ncbi:MAG: gamma-glutamyltransferase [Alphaproteobacteria bacterium]|nr:gamma-glutamyltransferase [Alphaproteobacteria bacterium]
MNVKCVLIAASIFAVPVQRALAGPQETLGTHGMVATAQAEASAVGQRILAAGGNAIDAAVAVGYALAVVEPCCGNIGGGGFMLVHRPGYDDKVINFREKAPLAATETMYLGTAGDPLRDASLYGYLAAGVPGTVMGLDRAESEFGRLGREAVMQPSIALAHDGFVLSESDAATLAAKAQRLAQDPAAARIFLHADGALYRAGERLVQSDLAHTLGLIAERGPAAFYRGPIATSMVEAAARNHGVLTQQDLAAYTTTEDAPVTCDYHDYHFISAPPPSSGGTVLCEMLEIVADWPLSRLGARTPQTVHLMAEAMRQGFRDRNTVLGDPAFVPDRHAELLSAAHIDVIRAAIDPARATPTVALPAERQPREQPQTTHYSVVDEEGNAASVTYTLNGNFGAAVVPPGTGFLLNNEMDDFSIKAGVANLFGLQQGAANAIAPGKRPLSSMTPVIVEKGGKPLLVVGSPGGPRIITTVFETILNIIDFGMTPGEAVAAPRFHHQSLPDTLYYERGAFTSETIDSLAERGYHLTEQSHWGGVELVAIGPNGEMIGVNDPRRPGGAALGN